MEWTVLLESAWDFFLSTFKLKRSVATHMLLLVVNSIYGKHSLDSVADIPIGYALTGPGVSFLEHVLPLVRHTVKELEVSGIQVKAKGTDLAYAHFIERDRNGEESHQAKRSSDTTDRGNHHELSQKSLMKDHEHVFRNQ